MTGMVRCVYGSVLHMVVSSDELIPTGYSLSLG